LKLEILFKLIILKPILMYISQPAQKEEISTKSKFVLK